MRSILAIAADGKNERGVLFQTTANRDLEILSSKKLLLTCNGDNNTAALGFGLLAAELARARQPSLASLPGTLKMKTPRANIF